MRIAKRLVGHIERLGGVTSDLKRVLGAAVVLLWGSVAAWAQGGDQSHVEEVLAVTPGNFPPQYAVDDAGNAVGFAIDAMNEVARLANIRLTYRVLDNWQAVQNESDAGRVDIVPNVGITPERATRWDFTDPIETFSVSLFARRSSDFGRGLLDLAGRKIGVERTNVARRLLEDRPDIEVLLFDTEERALFELLAGQVDAIAGPLPVVLKLSREIGVEARIEAVGEPLAEIKRAVAVSKDRPALFNRVNRAVSEFVHGPAYKRIYAKWYGRPAPFWTTSRVAWAMGALLALSLAMMGGWRQYSVLRLNRDLRESGAALAKAQALAHVGNWRRSIGRDELISSSPEYARIHGIGPDEIHELMKRRMERVIHPDDREQIAEISRMINEQGSDYDVEYRIVRPNGEVRYVLEIGEAVWDAAGRPVESVGTLQDITERKRAEEAIRKSEASLAQAQRIARLGNWELEVETDQLFWSAETYRIFGLEPQRLETPVEGFLDMVHPDDLDRVRRTWRRALKDCHPYDIVHRIVRSDGAVRVVHQQSETTYDEGGKPTRVTGTLQDITERKRVEDALRHSEERLASITDNLPGGVYRRMLHTDGTISYPFVSAGFGEIYGIDPEKAMSDSEYLFEALHPEDRARTLAAIRTSGETLELYDQEYRLIGRDGEVTWCRSIAQPRRLDGGGVVWDGVAVDITERKRAEETVRRSEERFRDFTETASDWFWEMDETLRYTYISERFEEVTGVPIKEVIGLTREELYNRHMTAQEKGDHEKWRAHYVLIEGRQAYRNMEVTWCYPDGTERTFAQSGKPVFDETGTFRGYRGTGVEITDRKKAEAALRDSEERFRGLFEQGAVGMAHASPDGRVLQVNQAHSRFTGYASSELIGKRFDLVVHPNDLREAAEHRRTVLGGGPVNPMHERRYRHKSGEVRWGLAGVAPFRDQDGTLKGYIVQVQDITDRKRAEEEIHKLNAELEQRVEARTAALRAAQEELVRKERLAALGQFTGTVGHELRNPLGAMRTSLAAIQKLARDDDDMLKRSVEIVERSILRCDKIVGELLDYSRVRDLVVEATALDGWLAELLDEYEIPPSVKLRRDLQTGATPAFDRDRLRRVMINLLDNACQSMTEDDDGTPAGRDHVLTVATRLTDGRVEISVGDNGPGIPSDQADRIFEPLFSTKAFGFGLGLSVVKQVVEQHGGGIEVDSKAGRGTRMVVSLPLLVPLQRVAS